ncbi:transcriptional regulator [Planctomycetales bacterium]|nr:transcriptional regulator [Planctomycetales bacterium]
MKKSAVPSEAEVFELADLFKIFSDSTRVQIMLTLSQGEKCVGDIAAAQGMNQSAISHQLRILKTNKLVKFRRAGKTSVYALADSHVESIIIHGIEHVRE